MRKDIENEIKNISKEVKEMLNKSELARRLGCDRRTVNRYLDKKENTSAVARNNKGTSKLDGYKDTIIEKVNKHGATAMSVHKFIQKKGYTGSYRLVSDFIQKHRNLEVQKATIRFETLPGLQAQVDWKEGVKMINKNGEIFSINIFLMVLGYSRMKFIKVTTDRKQKTLFMCLFEASKYLQGIPNEILFDNMATVVDRERSNFKCVQLNKTFSHFSQDAGFTPITCRPYRAQTKGKVESLAKFVDRLRVYNEEFETFEDLEKIAEEFNEEVNSELSQATSEKPIERFEKEKEYLAPLPTMDVLLSYFSYDKEYKVSKESMVNYKGKKYSVPTRFIGQLVTVTENEQVIQIYYMQDEIACHLKTAGKKLNYQRDHVAEILKSDALSHYSDVEIDEFIENNLKNMDILLK